MGENSVGRSRRWCAGALLLLRPRRNRRWLQARRQDDQGPHRPWHPRRNQARIRPGGL